MEEIKNEKDSIETIAKKIIESLCNSKDHPDYISKAAATQVLYPILAKVKTEVKLRSVENWYNNMANGNQSRIGVSEISAHLKKLNFIETKSFWRDLENEAGLFKAKLI